MKKKAPTKSEVSKPTVQRIQPTQMQQMSQMQQIPQMQAPQMQVPQMNMIYQNTNNNIIRPQQQVHGGFYGQRQNQGNENYSNQIFNDDDQILESVKETVKGQKAKIDIEIKAQRTMIKLKEETILPAMCSIKTSGGARTNVDLICVIDVSGSMNGDKIDLVKSTMKYLLETLVAGDRLSIITFESSGHRICGLKTCTQENMVALNSYIDSLAAGGGTHINSGLNLALKTMRDRKRQNKVTSIFLLSDGQDRGAQVTFKQTLKAQQNKDLGVFSIHSFGFGTDHDEDLMTKICEIKDGSFYFIKEYATLDEAFSNALGGIISVVASQVTIKLTNIAKNLVEGIKIIKTYGTSWEKINEKQYKIKLLQLMSGVSKDFVFELFIPAIDAEVGDVNRNHNVLEGSFNAKGVNEENMTGQCSLQMTLLNSNEQIPQINENIDVIQNHLRVQASEAIQLNMQLADSQKYQQAQKGLDDMINHIQTNKKARKDKVQHLVNDLQQIKSKCQKNVYQFEGKKCMKSAQMAHSKQANFAYSNAIQQDLVSKAKSKKMG